ncbi:DsrE/DsrF-like family protein [Luminiphilus syltensis NOR5-1B]|uniref:DsrE/DsrF-like family protein n=1 Tax=Luminiphilus syltensis NOR5-1B TaxID=565045 RepID=B8KQT1_9GAMM|nr:DsrE family protein [Luminiphilus syltensis]EED34488.1 DsrE/DsrF-like family protein [Luminiphilus syltensis NOR5-1B]
MIMTLVVQAGPEQGQAPQRALAFARAAIDAGHQLHCVFFYRGGVEVSGSEADAPEWGALHSETGTPLLLCSSSAETYGLSGDRHFAIAGLGTLIEAGVHSARVVTFA